MALHKTSPTANINDKVVRKLPFKPFIELAKAFAFRYTKLGAPRYPYNIEPIQLALLINELERLKTEVGNIVEIGVARGMTTRFICQHLVNGKVGNSHCLYAIDTFSSFTKSDIDFEVTKRGKSSLELRGFDYNDLAVWEKNFSQFPFVKAIKADCSTFNYSQIEPIKLAFLDVDLYLPTKNTLPRLYESTINGGVIIVDDVMDNAAYDGAYHAYIEFCETMQMPPKVIGNKCGLIYKEEKR